MGAASVSLKASCSCFQTSTIAIRILDSCFLYFGGWFPRLSKYGTSRSLLRSQSVVPRKVEQSYQVASPQQGDDLQQRRAMQGTHLQQQAAPQVLIATITFELFMSCSLVGRETTHIWIIFPIIPSTILFHSFHYSFSRYMRRSSTYRQWISFSWTAEVCARKRSS
jgi:hypothetical protein